MSDHSSRRSEGGEEQRREEQRREEQRKESRCEGPRSPQCDLEKMQEKEVQTAEFQSSCPGGESAEWPLG